MKKSYDEAKDEQTKKMYKEMLDNYDKQRAEMKQNAAEAANDPALAYNQPAHRPSTRRAERVATEMSKWEDKPGDAQKSMDEFAEGRRQGRPGRQERSNCILGRRRCMRRSRISSGVESRSSACAFRMNSGSPRA
jgi:hypothetical protein